MTGIVKCYRQDRGFGFIQPLVGKPTETPEVFFHASAIIGNRKAAIPTGAEVSFELVRKGNGRVQAANVKLRTLPGNTLARRTDGPPPIRTTQEHGASHRA